MKKIITLLALAALTTMSPARAIVVQEVHLKDGSVLSGFIQKQDTDGKITVQTDRAMICLNESEVTIENEKPYGEAELEKPWKEWAEAHAAYQGTAGHQTLTLADIRTKDGRSARKVRVLERGATIKFLELSPGTYTVDWADIEAVRGHKRPATALSGIDRIYQLRSGEQYEGQYAEETDSTLSLHMADGSIRTFKTDDVVKYIFKAVNPAQSLLAQSPLIDIIRQTNHAEIRGVIIEQNYIGGKDTENYVLIQQDGGAIQSIRMADIAEIRKEANKAYAPLTDIILKEGEVCVNRKRAAYVGVHEVDNNLVLDSIGGAVTVAKNAQGRTPLTIEYRSAQATGGEQFQLIKVTKAFVKKRPVYFFNYKDLVNSAYRASGLTTSVNRTTKAEYTVDRQGVFALYDAKAKRAVAIIVK